jgi:hypothetical protein
MRVRNLSGAPDDSLYAEQLNLGSGDAVIVVLSCVASGGKRITIVNAVVAADRTYTIPEVGADADLVMSAGNQTIAGTKTFSSVAIAAAGVISFGTVTLTRSGNNLIAALPTTNPAVAGALWSDSGTVKVSAG